MKYLILTLTLLLSINLFAVPTVDSTQITQAERIIDKYTGQVVEGVTSIVDALEKPAMEVFETVVMLQIIKGLSCMLSLLLAAIVFGSLIKGRYKLAKQIEEGYWEETAPGIMAIIFTIISFGSAVTFFATLYYSLSHIFAAKWFAILEIVNLVN